MSGKPAQTEWQPPKIPRHWPQWGLVCANTAKTTGKRCKNRAYPGSTQCRAHGGAGGKRGMRAYRRYLTWVALGGTPAHYDVVMKHSVHALARAWLKPEPDRAGVAISTEDKLVAARLLMQSDAYLHAKEHAIHAVLKHVADPELAAQIVEDLVSAGHIKESW